MLPDNNGRRGGHPGTASEEKWPLRSNRRDPASAYSRVSNTDHTAAKAAAMAAYNSGVLPLESCQLLFYQNPAWRSA